MTNTSARGIPLREKCGYNVRPLVLFHTRIRLESRGRGCHQAFSLCHCSFRDIWGDHLHQAPQQGIFSALHVNSIGNPRQPNSNRKHQVFQPLSLQLYLPSRSRASSILSFPATICSVICRVEGLWAQYIRGDLTVSLGLLAVSSRWPWWVFLRRNHEQ